MAAIDYSFRGLPEEVTVRIFENLNGLDLMSCYLVCHLFRGAVRNSSALRYNIQLALAGLEDGDGPTSVSAADRLTALRKSQHAWTTLRPRQRDKDMTMSHIWKIFGSVLARGVTPYAPQGLVFVELPSAVCDTPARRWEHPDLGVRIRTFAIDPAQDLAVLIAFPQDGTYAVYLRTMRSGGTHPLAAAKMVRCKPDTERECDLSIHVMGEFLAMLFHVVDRQTMDQLFVWDWQIGKIVAKMKALPRETRINSFSFLSPRHFVVSRFQSRPDTVYSRFQSGSNIQTPVLEVYEFLAEVSTATPTLVRSFEFPRMANHGLIRTMLMRSNPPPHSPASPGAPFRTAPASCVLAVSLDVDRPGQDVYYYALFVHHSTLLEGLEAEHVPGATEVRVPWEKWGPQKSRMISTLYNEQTWTCYMHGTRYVRLEPEDGNDASLGSRVRMLDFNALGLHRKYTHIDGGESSDRGEIYPASHPTVITANNVFEHDIETTLPYREVRSREVFCYNAIMIDEGCLVGLVPGEAGVPEGFEFLCF